MNLIHVAVLSCLSAFAAVPTPPPSGATAAAAATTTAPALDLSTYTVATLYTADRTRDPFMPPAMSGGPAHRDATPLVVDIHALQLRGIMKDAKNDFALFSMENGTTLMLRGDYLYDDRNKVIPGISGRIQIKRQQAELITADEDVQIYSLGEPGDEGANKASESAGKGTQRGL